MSQSERQGLAPEMIQAAYARLARYYDFVFGPLLGPARAAAVQKINALTGQNVLEVGVGTGIALPNYAKEKRVVGIDMSPEMLAKARERVARLKLANVVALHEMDAEATGFQDHQFDIAVAMFVASVVPNPRLLLAEMRRVVKPGGWLVVVNHFARQDGPEWWQKFSVATTRRLGWRADFRLQDLFDASDLASAQRSAQWPFGMFQLIVLQR